MKTINQIFNGEARLTFPFLICKEQSVLLPDCRHAIEVGEVIVIKERISAKSENVCFVHINLDEGEYFIGVDINDKVWKIKDSATWSFVYSNVIPFTRKG